MARQPEGPPPPPTVQKLRIRYAKRGRLRFASHRDLARALERALRRAQVPMAFSAGFSPHPKISYIGAAPTGAATGRRWTLTTEPWRPISQLARACWRVWPPTCSGTTLSWVWCWGLLPVPPASGFPHDTQPCSMGTGAGCCSWI